MAKNLGETRDMAGFQALLNQMNQVGPFGSLTFSGPTINTKFGPQRDPTQTTATTTLSPEMQRLLDQQMVAQRLLGRQGIDLARALPGAGTQVLDPFQMRSFGPAASAGLANPFNLQTMMGANTDFSAERDRVEQATFGRAMGLLNPEIDRSEERLRQRLANQGLPQASRAATAELGRFEDTSNQAREQAAMGAILAGGQEQSRLLGDLLGTSALGVGQALDLRRQLGGEQVQQYGMNANAALANRQIPFQEMLALFGQQPTPDAGAFFAPAPTGLVNYSSQPAASGTNPALGALAGAGSGAATGAAIGSAFPGVGTAMGAGLGAGFGGFLSLLARS